MMADSLPELTYHSVIMDALSGVTRSRSKGVIKRRRTLVRITASGRRVRAAAGLHSNRVEVEVDPSSRDRDSDWDASSGRTSSEFNIRKFSSDNLEAKKL